VGVPDGVGDGLLRHAEQAERHVRTERVETVACGEAHGDLMERLDIGAVTPQCCHQAHVLEHTGMQFVREVPDGLGEIRDAFLECRDRDVEIRLRAWLAGLALEATQDDPHAGELLTHVVVQVAGDAATLLFLNLDQTAGEILILLLDPSPFGDIDRRPDVAGEPAGVLVAWHADVQHPPVLAIGASQTVFHAEGSRASNALT
jgi:hypothetical protein